MGQISQALNSRPKGALPSDTVVNPKGENNTGHAMAITTRSGRGGNAPTSSQMQLVDDEQVVQRKEVSNNVMQSNDEVRNDIDDNVEETQEDSLSINVPLVESLEQMPGYAKFMKNLVTKKRSINFETIKVTHQVSAIVHSMAPKLEDPGALTIPCTIGSAEFAKSFCDLGGNINLMPFSIFKTLGIGQPRPTSMILQMADRTMKKPLGVIEDVLDCVDKFILLADFVIVGCEVDYEVPIILRRPFLATEKDLYDAEAIELTLWVGNENVISHMCKAMRQPNSNEVCSLVDLVTDIIVDDKNAIINIGDILEAVLLKFDVNEDGFMECVNSLKGMGSYNYAPRKLSLDLENRKTSPTKSSIEEPPTLELKPLPPHLRFYIGGATKEKEGYWVDIGGYSGDKSRILHDKINLEEGDKPSIEHQRRLNETMQEVVKKEIIK
ncbi:uncharacterized protein [Nicotiana tomentosiformis]|uniref:uncharacterized protein n=1 Tax=Nicotiana tomentosiformis TaxID=4098 RepID=UPI00388CD9D1